jgi:hypothetical protein
LSLHAVLPTKLRVIVPPVLCGTAPWSRVADSLMATPQMLGSLGFSTARIGAQAAADGAQANDPKPVRLNLVSESYAAL